MSGRLAEVNLIRWLAPRTASGVIELHSDDSGLQETVCLLHIMGFSALEPASAVDGLNLSRSTKMQSAGEKAQAVASGVEKVLTAYSKAKDLAKNCGAMLEKLSQAFARVDGILQPVSEVSIAIDAAAGLPADPSS